MTIAQQTTAQALPYKHTDLGYPAEVLTPEFKRFLSTWHAAGDILKRQPPGTRAKVAGLAGWLMMAPMQGELFLFSVNDLTGPFELCRASGPHNPRHPLANPVDVAVLKKQTDVIARWVANPVFDSAIDPELLGDVLCSTYRQDGPTNWVWNGNDPAVQK